ncbi:retrovirus-related pol polyprotein from transposon TNT 1-94 [Tanacetum coccineum]
MYTASLKRSENYKAQPYQYASPSKQILKEKAKPFPPCTHCGFNDHRPDDYRNYPECEIYRSYYHLTSGHNHVIHIRGGVLVESSQTTESSIGVKCNTYGSTVHSNTDHNEFDHFKRGEKIQATKAREPIWYLDSGCSRSMTGVKSYLHKYVEQLVSPMSINNEKYTLVIIDEYSRMVENQNDVKVKQIRTNNETEFRNHELESFYDKKGISQNISSPYTPEQIGVAERKNRTLIEAARTISIIIKRHDKTPYERFQERIPNISYFHVFGCLVFIHTHKDHLGKFDAKADDGYFLGYYFVSKAFRVFNMRRQQVEETYHVTFDESMEAIRFTNALVDKIGIDDSSRYPPNEIIHKDDPSRQYQANSNILYYVIPHGRSLTELTQENHVPEVIALNEHEIPHTKDAEGTPDLINTEGTPEQNVQDEQIINKPTKGPSGLNTKVLVSINESLLLNIPQPYIYNQASTSSHHVPQDRWSKDQHTKLMNIIGDPGEGMLTRSMAAKLTAASASECLFVNFLSKIEPKKVSETLKHPRWVNAI